MKCWVCLDPSWAATGVVIIEEGDSNPWVSARCTTIKTTKKKFPNESERLVHIVDRIFDFATGNEITAVYLEDVYAGFAVKQLARLRGAIDVETRRRLCLEVQPVNVSAARKLLLGPIKKLDRKQAKKIVLARWQAAGAPVADDAQADAMTIANYALHLRGKECLTK